LKNLSANDLGRRNIAGITLEERLVYELKYFEETGNHLDIKNWTLCAGSCYSDGFVPGVYWVSVAGELVVGGFSPGDRGGVLRSRAAVFS